MTDTWKIGGFRPRLTWAVATPAIAGGLAGVALALRPGWVTGVVLAVLLGMALASALARDAANAATTSLAFIVVAPRLLHPLGPVGPKAMDALTLLLLGTCFLRALAARRGLPYRGLLPTVLLWTLFCGTGISILSQVYLLRVPLIFRDLFEFYRLPLYVFALGLGAQIDWTDSRLWRRLLVPLFALTVLVAAICAVQRFLGQLDAVSTLTLLFSDRSKDPMPWLRAIGTFESHNPVAQFLTLGGALAAAVAVCGRVSVRARLALGAVALVALVGIMLSLSRSGAIGMATVPLVVAAQFVYRGGRRWALPRLVLVGAGFTLMAAGALRLAPPDFQGWVVSKLASGTSSYGAQWRLRTWSDQLETFTEYPLFGCGPRKFLLGRGEVSFSDSSYVQAAVGGGIVAVLLWLALLGTLFWRAQRVSWLAASPTARAYGIGLQAAVIALGTAALATDVFTGLKVMPIFLLLSGALYGIPLSESPTTEAADLALSGEES